MNNRWTLITLGWGLAIAPMASVLADAPIVQGHSIQSATVDNAAVASAAASVVQTPDQALVTADNSNTASGNNNPLALASQVNSLQQQVMDLRGQLEVQGHSLSQLQTQYQDVLNRLNQANGGKSLTMAAVAAPAAPASTASSTASTTAAPATASNQAAPAAAATPATPAAASTTAASNANATTATAAPATTATAAPSPAAKGAEEQAYQQAYNQLVAKQYSQATVSLQTYLQQYPNGQYASTSHYWLGELALIAGNPTAAQSQFNIVVNQFGQSPKAPDSLLKIGMIYYDEAQWQKAKTQFNAVVSKYPGTTAAQLANQQLQQLQQQGV